MSNLTSKDIELTRRYITLRTAIKSLNNDLSKIKESEFELKTVFVRMIESTLIKANNELRELNKYPLNVKKTDQPTVYEVKIGNRQGFVEINVVEITQEVSKLF